MNDGDEINTDIEAIVNTLMEDIIKLNDRLEDLRDESAKKDTRIDRLESQLKSITEGVIPIPVKVLTDAIAVHLVDKITTRKVLVKKPGDQHGQDS